MLIAGDFYGPFITFISLLAVPITAWVAVFLADMLFRREYDPRGLMDTTRTGVYWYRGGFRATALVPWLAGIVVGLLFTTAATSRTDVWFSGPLADSWMGSNGLGWVAAFVVAGGLYLLLGAAAPRLDAQADDRPGAVRP
jgi:purine-cytosine permease-like protein